VVSKDVEAELRHESLALNVENVLRDENVTKLGGDGIALTSKGELEGCRESSCKCDHTGILLPVGLTQNVHLEANLSGQVSSRGSIPSRDPTPKNDRTTLGRERRGAGTYPLVWCCERYHPR
jgi:hypothetical protein